MSIKNMHPDFLAGLTKQVPKGARIKSLLSEGPLTSLVTIELDGELIQKRIDKINIKDLLNTAVKEIEVEDGASLETVYLDFCDKYKLPIINKVDFLAQPGFIDLNGRSEVTLTLDILPTSIGIFGSVEIKVLDKNRIAKNAGTLNLGMTEIKMKLALVNVKHQLDKAKLFNGNKLTNGFATHLFNYVSDLGFDRVSLSDFKSGAITYDFDDGLSNLFMFKLVDGRTYAIRYESHADDRPNLT